MDTKSGTDWDSLVCNGEELAYILGITQRTVVTLNKDGIIHPHKAKVNNRTINQYQMTEAVREYVQSLLDRANGRRSQSEEALRKRKLEVDIQLKESQGELHQLKTAIASGKYISVAEVQMDYEKFFMVFKRFALNLPARIVGLIAGKLEPVEARRMEQEIAQEINGLLESFIVSGTEEKPVEILPEKKPGRPRKDATAKLG